MILFSLFSESHSSTHTYIYTNTYTHIFTSITAIGRGMGNSTSITHNQSVATVMPPYRASPWPQVSRGNPMQSLTWQTKISTHSCSSSKHLRHACILQKIRVTQSRAKVRTLGCVTSNALRFRHCVAYYTSLANSLGAVHSDAQCAKWTGEKQVRDRVRTTRTEG